MLFSFAACFILGLSLAYSSTLKMEAIFHSVDLQRPTYT
jgi:hypothetical protein